METAEFADSHREDETPDLGAEEENNRNTGKLETRSILQTEPTPLSVKCANQIYPQTNGDKTPRIPDVSPDGMRCTRNQDLGEKSEPAKKGADGKVTCKYLCLCFTHNKQLIKHLHEMCEYK